MWGWLPAAGLLLAFIGFVMLSLVWRRPVLCGKLHLALTFEPDVSFCMAACRMR